MQVFLAQQINAGPKIRKKPESKTSKGRSMLDLEGEQYEMNEFMGQQEVKRKQKKKRSSSKSTASYDIDELV
ncbi:unnamed protein product [Protopolystoma xenopodis]|uniref:Uncharacterized protein n=1 Tax=Protopolystoma xenopodis TaxID=117903 RepID=A0A3S5A6W3_9PLAT|nr:unnamed protein product [Protopolystoma xenopodis]